MCAATYFFNTYYFLLGLFLIIIRVVVKTATLPLIFLLTMMHRVHMRHGTWNPPLPPPPFKDPYHGVMVYTHYSVTGLTKSSAQGVRSTLQSLLGSQKSLTGSPGDSLENLEDFLKIRTQLHRNISPRLLVSELISEHLLNILSFALK